MNYINKLNTKRDMRNFDENDDLKKFDSINKKFWWKEIEEMNVM